MGRKSGRLIGLRLDSDSSLYLYKNHATLLYGSTGIYGLLTGPGRYYLSGRLLKDAHLRRYPHSSSLRRTSMSASLFGILGALHLDVFEQPAHQVFFSNLLE
jgi:hypothetical protein